MFSQLGLSRETVDTGWHTGGCQVILAGSAEQQVPGAPPSLGLCH